MQRAAFSSCEEAARNLRLQGGRVGVDAGFPDYRVPAARDHDNDGLVCEGHIPANVGMGDSGTNHQPLATCPPAYA